MAARRVCAASIYQRTPTIQRRHWRLEQCDNKRAFTAAHESNRPYVDVLLECAELLGPDLQNILRQSCDYLTIVPNIRSTYDGRLIYKTSYKGRKAFLKCDSLAKL